MYKVTLSIVVSVTALICQTFAQTNLTLLLSEIPACTVGWIPLLPSALANLPSSSNVPRPCFYQRDVSSPILQNVFARMSTCKETSPFACLIHALSLSKLVRYRTQMPKLSLSTSKLMLAESLTALQNDVCKGVPQPSRSKEIIRDIIIMAAATFPVVILRFVSRRMVSNKIGLDDWAVAIGAVSLHLVEPPLAQPLISSNRL
jgi:hypothetical protein